MKNPLGTVEKCNNLGWQIQPALHLHFQCFHPPSLLKMKKVIHLKETHENACHTTKQPGPFGYTRPLLLSEIILGAQQFSPLSICRGFFKMNLGGHCCVCGKQFQTPFHYVSLHINRMIFFYSLCPISTTAGFPCLK